MRLPTVCVLVATTRCHYWWSISAQVPCPGAGGVEEEGRYSGHMRTISPYPLWTNRHLWKHYLPTTSFAGGNNVRGVDVPGPMSRRMSCTRVLFGSYMSIGSSLIRVSVSASSAFFIVSPTFSGSPSENRIPLQRQHRQFNLLRESSTQSRTS